MDIKDLRSKLDAIDAQIVHLYAERMEIASQIADYKKERGLPVLDAAREKELLDKIDSLAGDELGTYVRALYERLLETSRDYQSKKNSNK